MKFELKLKDVLEGRLVDDPSFLLDCHGVPRVGEEIFLYEKDLNIYCVVTRVCWFAKVASGLDKPQEISVPFVEAELCSED